VIVSDSIKERAVVFVDGNNLHRGLRKCYEIDRLELEAFCRLIVEDRELRWIYYADSNFIQQQNPQSYSLQQKYFSYLRSIKYLIFRRGYYNTHTHPPTEKKADVYLATDMVDLCYRDEFDVANVVSGDADLTPAIDIVAREGKKVFNVYFDKPGRNSRAVLPHCNGNFREITYNIAERFKWEPKKA